MFLKNIQSLDLLLLWKNHLSNQNLEKKIMKTLYLLVSMLGLACGSHFLEGYWEEDQNQRENLDDFLYYRGVSWFERVYATSASFVLIMKIEKQGNIFVFSGIRGPLQEEYKSEIIPNNIESQDLMLILVLT